MMDILTSVVHVIKKSLRNKKYKFEDFLDWQEGIASYVLSEAAFKKRDILESIGGA